MGALSKLLGTKSSAETAASPAGAGEDTPDFAAVRGNLSRSGKRGRAAAAAAEAERDEVLQKEIEKLYTPEQWKAIATLYFDARYVSTGDELFRLKESEELTLGASLAASAKLLLKIDPGYVAIIIFLANMGKMIAIKETQYSQKRKRTARPAQPARPSDGQTVRA